MNVTELLNSVPTGLWQGGRSVPSESGRTFDVVNPATGEVLASVANATPADARAALDMATAVADDWAATPARTRAEILRAAFEAVRSTM